eukprot:scaffold182484_cov21-Prasinocladus_malaysianus.AAC.1
MQHHGWRSDSASSFKAPRQDRTIKLVPLQYSSSTRFEIFYFPAYCIESLSILALGESRTSQKVDMEVEVTV